MLNFFYKKISARIRKAVSAVQRKERKQVEKEFKKKSRQRIAETKRHYIQMMSEQKKNYEQIITIKNKEIQNMKNKFRRRKNDYEMLRKREYELDMLTADFENIADAMSVRVQEAIQPLLRSRGKIHYIRRNSDKKDEKITKIFEIS
jgi:hypothetical protein